MPAERVAHCIEQVGIGFMFARAHHPAMRHAAPVRAELGVRTLFNLLGPLTNPAGATHQLLGVSDVSKLRLIADVLGLLGIERAWVVHGTGAAGRGIDEVSVSGPTRVAEVRGGKVSECEVLPEDFGVARSGPEALCGGDATENAAIIRAVLAGEPGARRDAVVVNAGAALCVAGTAPDPRQGATLAAQAIDSGAAMAKLAAWVEIGRRS
jgi:anthranilate phosphoribosyltransferase